MTGVQTCALPISAENAIILDTSDMTLEESIDALVKLVEERV